MYLMIPARVIAPVLLLTRLRYKRTRSEHYVPMHCFLTSGSIDNSTVVKNCTRKTMFGSNNFGGSRNFGGPRDSGPREMTKVTCSDCGKECEVPFKPTEGRPVYCRDCLPKHRKPRF